LLRERPGSSLYQALRAAGLTEADLAHGDLSAVYIQMIADGQIRPSLEVLQSLAEKLGKPVSSFLEGLPGSQTDVLLLVNLASACLEQDALAQAGHLLGQAQEYAASLKDARVMGLVHLQSCRLSRCEGDLDQAEQHAVKALRLLQEHGETDDIAQAMMYLGNVAWVQRKLNESVARYQDALALAQETANTRLTLRLYHNLGNALLLLDEWDAAEDYLSRAAELAQRESDGWHQTKAYVNLALACRERGELDRALELSAKALSSADENRRPRVTADIYNHMGSVHARRVDWHRARACYEKALGLLPQGTRQVTEAQRELARISLEEGRFVTARSQAKEAYDGARQSEDAVEEGRCALLYAQALVSTGQEIEAVPYLHRARALFNRIGIRQDLIVTEDLLSYIAREDESW